MVVKTVIDKPSNNTCVMLKKEISENVIAKDRPGWFV